MKDNDDLVDYLVATGVLESEHLMRAFRTIDRKDFVQVDYDNEAYGDYPLPIGYGQTISQPTTVALMLEFLEVQKGGSILDIGSGSGWTTALLAELVGKSGSVLGLELVPELVEFGSENLDHYGFKHARIEQAGEKLGRPDEKFDKILVSAAAEELPEELIEQLKVGGVLVVPVGNAILKVTKTAEDKTETERRGGFTFVPLVT